MGKPEIDLSQFDDGLMGREYRRPPISLAHLLWQLKTRNYGIQDDKDFVYGVDLSHWNTAFSLDPQWWADRYTEGYRFAILKVTEGTWHIDTVWEQHTDLARDHGFELGYYHYARNNVDGISQARFMIDTVETHIDPALIKLGYHYDLESDEGYPASTLNIRAEQFLRTIPIEFGFTPWMYSASWFLDPRYPELDPQVDYLRWVANWTLASEPFLPKIWRDHIGYHNWQFNADTFDKNRMKRDVWNLLVGEPEPEPPPQPPDPTLERRVDKLEAQVAGLEGDVGSLQSWGRGIGYPG